MKKKIVFIIAIILFLISISIGTYMYYSQNKYIPVDSINIDVESVSIDNCKTFTLNHTINPINSTNKHIIYTSENTEICEVSSDGVITTINAGVTNIKITVENESVEIIIPITVEPIPEDISISAESLTMYKGLSETIQASVILSIEAESTLETEAVGSSSNVQIAETKKELIWSSSNPEVADVNQVGLVKSVAEGQATITVASAYNNNVYKTISIEVIKKIMSDNYGITHVNGILIANKKHHLPATYAPGENAIAKKAFNEMRSEASAQGISLFIVSGYRSYDLQKQIFDGNVRLYGEAEANRASARPGESEHQTGLSFDINSVENSFAGTPEAIWLEQNCARYVFIIRYPRGKEHITGYIYEPWHIRYIGIDNAINVTNSGLTLEEYLGI
jgi:hypothetical protein